MADWDPDLYRLFEGERTRPAQDLLGRVDLVDPGMVVDLGCGPGNSTELLARRFPSAVTIGVDTSASMLDSARERLPDCRFMQGDIATWQPEDPVDLLYANASLQWVMGHEALVPRLFAMLRPGGVLAFQVPDNLDEPSHRSMREVAAEGPWADRLAQAAEARVKILSPAGYYDLLATGASQVDTWRTAYQHPMPSPAAIATWLRSTGLRPFLAPLAASEQTEFLARYEARIAEAYPARSDGFRLLAFPRLFVVAQRKAV